MKPHKPYITCNEVSQGVGQLRGHELNYQTYSELVVGRPDARSRFTYHNRKRGVMPATHLLLGLGRWRLASETINGALSQSDREECRNERCPGSKV